MGPGEQTRAGVRIITPDAIFFDFDGVLVDSTPIKVRAFTTLYTEYGPEKLARVMAYMKGKEGISRVDKIRHAHKAFLGIELSEEDLAVLAERYSKQVEEAVIDCPWVPGAQEFLEANRSRFPLFVVTGTPEAEILRIVERRAMGRYFVSVRGSPPDKPPIVRELLARHGLSPERCLFVGDAPFDFETALVTRLNFIGRVPEGDPSPFPEGTVILPDLTRLPDAMEAMTGEERQAAD